MDNEKETIELKPVEITGALRKGDLFCWYGFRQEIAKEQYNTVPSVRSDRPMHEDLRFAFDAITIHLPFILQELPMDAMPGINAGITGASLSAETQELLDLFKVFGIEIDPDENSVSIIGRKSLALGFLPIKTPFIKFDGPYDHALELRILCDRLVEEVKLYIGGKQAPTYEQQDLFEQAAGRSAEDNDGDGADLTVAPIKKGRGRPKRIKPEDAPQGADAAGDGLSDLDRANLGGGETEPLSTFFKEPKLAGREQSF